MHKELWKLQDALRADELFMSHKLILDVSLQHNIYDILACFKKLKISTLYCDEAHFRLKKPIVQNKINKLHIRIRGANSY